MSPEQVGADVDEVGTHAVARRVGIALGEGGDDVLVTLLVPATSFRTGGAALDVAPHREIAGGVHGGLVDGDPLADITVLQDHDRLNVIMKDGKFHKEDAPIDKRSAVDAHGGRISEKTREYVEARP